MMSRHRELYGPRAVRRSARLAALAATIGVLAPAGPGCSDCPSNTLASAYVFENSLGDWSASRRSWR
jgi:hypothetical protein